VSSAVAIAVPAVALRELGARIESLAPSKARRDTTPERH
jgi:hypothetical protein